MISSIFPCQNQPQFSLRNQSGSFEQWQEWEEKADQALVVSVSWPQVWTEAEIQRAALQAFISGEDVSPVLHVSLDVPGQAPLPSTVSKWTEGNKLSVVDQEDDLTISGESAYADNPGFTEWNISLSNTGSSAVGKKQKKKKIKSPPTTNTQRLLKALVRPNLLSTHIQGGKSPELWWAMLTWICLNRIMTWRKLIKKKKRVWPLCLGVKTHSSVCTHTTGTEETGSEIIRKGLQLLVITAALQSESWSKVTEMLADVTLESQTQIQSGAKM